jgi:thiol:disulfide interchange protein DsbC
MKLRHFSMLLTLTISLFIGVFNVSAAEANVKASTDTTKAPEINAAIKSKLLRIGLTATKIEPSPMPGIKQIFTDRGLFYTSDDGKFFIAGRMFDLEAGMVNLTEAASAKQRLDGIKQFEDSMIVFPAENEKYAITVFTDTTCGYCKKMHAQIDEYNDLGITVKYLAFPRSGLQGRGYKEITSVWCAANQQSAMTAAKNGIPVTADKCDAPIEAHYNLGQAAGVTGTPAIILANGVLIPGYKPPQALLQSLKAI